MFDNAHPASSPGFVGARRPAARARTTATSSTSLLVAMAAVPLVFFAHDRPAARRRAPRSRSRCWASTGSALAIAHAVLLRDLPHGDGIIIDVLVGTFIGDTGAYFGGRAFGSQKLAPAISPNKTVEGLGIGLLTAVAAVWFAGLYQDWLSGVDALILGAGGRRRRAGRRPVRVLPQARRRQEGRRHAVRRARRRARPARRRALHAGRRLLRLVRDAVAVCACSSHGGRGVAPFDPSGRDSTVRCSRQGRTSCGGRGIGRRFAVQSRFRR